MIKNGKFKLVYLLLVFIIVITSQMAYTKNKSRIDRISDDLALEKPKSNKKTAKGKNSKIKAKASNSPTNIKVKAKVAATSYRVKGKRYTTLSSDHAKDLVQTGYASWYGPGFHGKKTANGERYNQNAMTAAHKTLPLSSKIKVTNLENNKSIILRVNDRGPYHGNRILDLSKAAAADLGVIKKGTAKIKLEVLSI